MLEQVEVNRMRVGGRKEEPGDPVLNGFKCGGTQARSTRLTRKNCQFGALTAHIISPVINLHISTHVYLPLSSSSCLFFFILLCIIEIAK